MASERLGVSGRRAQRGLACLRLGRCGTSSYRTGPIAATVALSHVPLWRDSAGLPSRSSPLPRSGLDRGRIRGRLTPGVPQLAKERLLCSPESPLWVIPRHMAWTRISKVIMNQILLNVAAFRPRESAPGGRIL